MDGATNGLPLMFDISVEERRNTALSSGQTIPGLNYDKLRGIPNTGNTCGFACAAAIIAHFPKLHAERAMSILDNIVANSASESSTLSSPGLLAATL